MKNDVTEKIRKIRVDKGISQENVADELGITHSAYSKIERGETDPNLTRLFELAEILEVNIIDFFTGDMTQTFKETKDLYGNAGKGELEKISNSILSLKMDIQELRSEIIEKKIKPAKALKKK